MQTKNVLPKYFICSLATKAVRKMVAYYNRSIEPRGVDYPAGDGIESFLAGGGFKPGRLCTTGRHGQSRRCHHDQGLFVIHDLDL